MRTEHIAVSSETAEGVLRELGRHAVEARDPDRILGLVESECLYQ